MPKWARIAFIWLRPRRSVTMFFRFAVRCLASPFGGWVRRHAAMALLAAQPAEKGAHQQFCVEAISLCAPACETPQYLRDG